MLTVVKRDEDEFNSWLKKRAAKAAVTLEKWGLDPADLLSTEIGWLLCLPKFNDKALVLDLFQVAFILCAAKFRIMNKSRQIGFSFAIACESIARTHLRDRHSSVCVSYNLDDAKEKVSLVKELHDDLPLEFQKKIVVDSKTVVGFRSNASKRRISKVISNPAKAPRGKSGDVYLDELAHCTNDKSIYQGATAVVSRSGGQLTIGSTPLGQRGRFYNIFTDRSEFPNFWRQNVPWWLCSHFSKIAKNPELCKLAWTLPTEVRVERFGTLALQDQFNALPIEDFKQEFECEFQDERVAFFPYDLIEPCCQREADQLPVYDNIRMLADKADRIGPLFAGFDVGRSKHPSELFIFSKEMDRFVLRYHESFRNIPFPTQRKRLIETIRTLGDNLRRFRIDETGLGKNLAEDLVKNFGRGKIEPVTFTMPIKEELANNLKILFQERGIELSRDRATISQIHSIKQKLTAAGNSVFDAERNRHHHADRMWAIALAVRTKRKKVRKPATLGVRILGEKVEEKPTPVKAEAQPSGGRTTARAVIDRGLVDRLFDDPTEHRNEDRASPPTEGSQVVAWTGNSAEARRRADTLSRAASIYARLGDEAKARQMEREASQILASAQIVGD